LYGRRLATPRLPDFPANLLAQVAEAAHGAEAGDAEPPGFKLVGDATMQSGLVLIQRLVLSVGDFGELWLCGPSVEYDSLPVLGWRIIRAGLVGGEDVQMMEAARLPVACERREEERERCAPADPIGGALRVPGVGGPRQAAFNRRVEHLT